MTGPTMPFDAFTGDTIHQYFQMVQQVDCAIDAEHVSKKNPTGCLHDLQSAVTTTYSTPPTGTPHDTGQTMAFFNMQQGDAPFFKSLADQYTLSDNYHQPVLGGTGPDSQPLGFADQVFFSDGNGNPATPAAANIYNPDPQPGTLNLYTQRAQWFDCSDDTHPGIAAIKNYLKALPYKVKPAVRRRRILAGGQCESGFHAARHCAERPGGAADESEEHRRCLERTQHLLEILRRRLQRLRNDEPVEWQLLQHLQSVRVRGQLSRGGCRSHAGRHRLVHGSSERHASGGILCEAGRHHGRAPGLIEMDPVRGLCAEHRRNSRKAIRNYGPKPPFSSR